MVRYRQSRGLTRDRMRWLAWSVVVIAGYQLVSTVVLDLEGTDYVGIVVAMVLPGAAMTVAIVRPNLVAIDDLLGRTVVVAAIVAALVAADAAVLGVLTSCSTTTSPRRRSSPSCWSSRSRSTDRSGCASRRSIRRRMLGERGNRYDALAGLSSTLENTDDAGEQLAAVARAVAAAFGVRFVSLEVDWSSGERMVTTHGERPAAVRTLPITYRGAEVGRLVLPAKGVRSRLSTRDEQLLGDLVRQAATAVRTSQLAEEVQQSRERLVTAREEERRRIRRDLHDGLGPSLSGTVFQLEAARMAVDTRSGGGEAAAGGDQRARAGRRRRRTTTRARPAAARPRRPRAGRRDPAAGRPARGPPRGHGARPRRPVAGGGRGGRLPDRR